MAEALYLTQGFAYDSAEQAEARFVNANEDEYIYARYGNPTVRIFEDRIAALEGAEDAFATASGMAASTPRSCPCSRRATTSSVPGHSSDHVSISWRSYFRASVSR